MPTKGPSPATAKFAALIRILFNEQSMELIEQLGPSKSSPAAELNRLINSQEREKEGKDEANGLPLSLSDTHTQIWSAVQHFYKYRGRLAVYRRQPPSRFHLFSPQCSVG